MFAGVLMSYCQEVGHQGSLSSLASSVLYQYNDYKASHQTAGRSGRQDSDLTNKASGSGRQNTVEALSMIGFVIRSNTKPLLPSLADGTRLDKVFGLRCDRRSCSIHRKLFELSFDDPRPISCRPMSTRVAIGGFVRVFGTERVTINLCDVEVVNSNLTRPR